MSVDIGFFADCHFHAVCGGIVIPGQDVCDTCRTEWGQLLRPVTATMPIVASNQETAAVKLVERRQQQESGELARPGQTCWLCERRAACVKKVRGWECSDCLMVV